MASSKNRLDWALLLLRLALGGAFILKGWQHLPHGGRAMRLDALGDWALAFMELIGGAFLLIGLGQLIVGLVLVGALAWPLVHGWMHGAGPFFRPESLFLVLTTLAAALAGPGRWAVGKG